LAAKFVLRQDGQDRYLIVFQTHSGQILLTSEVRYKDIALSKISATRSLAQNQKNYMVHTAETGGSYFTIRNARGEVVALSDMYPDPESMLKGIDLVRRNARGARLEDLTVPPPRPTFRKGKQL
jgi:uncharacterized protein YegP (UPF0339 family)